MSNSRHCRRKSDVNYKILNKKEKIITTQETLDKYHERFTQSNLPDRLSHIERHTQSALLAAASERQKVIQ